ncbi:hypothetical protein RDWZM_003826 [Blomia tropicalis]|uniref:alpha-1,2-Mannosidase n=1 Tax=Blomia tropicalis TaxID=40697 RepID=A0A9Q0RTE1_BLOTA|nr:hypothetical protein RDWZM_003826 [Blomia tropicalis]
MLYLMLLMALSISCWSNLDEDDDYGPIVAETIREKQLFVRKMTMEAFHSYHRYAWGANSLSSVSGKAEKLPFGRTTGLTIVASLSTLWVMNMDDEYRLAREWIEHDFQFDNIDPSLITGLNIIPSYMGGLLSAYALTNDSLYLQKSFSIEKQLRSVLYQSSKSSSSQSSTPSLYNLNSTYIRYLADLARNQPEYVYLTRMGNIPHQMNITRFIGLIDQMNPLEDSFTELLKLDFYYTLIRLYLQSGDRDHWLLYTYQQLIEHIEQHRKSDSLFFAKLYDEKLKRQREVMYDAASYVGGMLALGSDAIKRLERFNKQNVMKLKKHSDRHMWMAQQLTEKIHQAASSTKTGLIPSAFFTDEDGLGGSPWWGKSNQLIPSLAESYFILWRLTKDQRYRIYAWEMVKAIYRHCRTNLNAYSGIYDVNQVPSIHGDYMKPQFISGTLKYLYLIFEDDEQILPLSQWFFNQHGHPLPICGRNPNYSNCL